MVLCISVLFNYKVHILNAFYAVYKFTVFFIGISGLFMYYYYVFVIILILLNIKLVNIALWISAVDLGDVADSVQCHSMPMIEELPLATIR